MCIFCCTFAHVYILPHILHHRATALPHSSLAHMLDSGTPMPSQYALCAVRIYGINTRANILWHHALWLLVRVLLCQMSTCSRREYHTCTLALSGILVLANKRSTTARTRFMFHRYQYFRYKSTDLLWICASINRSHIRSAMPIQGHLDYLE